jgi:ankyrin repeat protein
LKIANDSFFELIEKGDIASVKSQLNTIDLSKIMDKHGRSPMLRACQKGHLGLVKLFVEEGIKVSADDFVWAVDNNSKELVDYFIEQNCPVSERLFSLSVWMYNMKAIQYCLDRGITIQSREVMSNILRNNDFKLAEFFISKGYDLSLVDHNLETPFFEACRFGKLKFIELFEKNGADINAVNKTGVSPCQIAIEKKHLDVISYFIDRIEGLSNENYAPLLFWSIPDDNVELVKKIVKLGYDINRPFNGKVAIVSAVNYKNIEMVKFFLENGADINLRNHNENSAISLAYERGYHDFFPLFEEYRGVCDDDNLKLLNAARIENIFNQW